TDAGGRGGRGPARRYGGRYRPLGQGRGGRGAAGPVPLLGGGAHRADPGQRPGADRGRREPFGEERGVPLRPAEPAARLHRQGGRGVVAAGDREQVAADPIGGAGHRAVRRDRGEQGGGQFAAAVGDRAGGRGRGAHPDPAAGQRGQRVGAALRPGVGDRGDLRTGVVQRRGGQQRLIVAAGHRDPLPRQH